MREAMRRDGEFARLSATQRRDKITALLAVLNHEEYRFSALHITVDVAVYAKELEGYKGYGGNPYFFAFHMFINAAILEMLDRPVREQCEIFFDEHPSLGEKSKRWYPFTRSLMTPDEKIVAPVEPFFRDDKQFMPLQAADMVAWIQRRANSESPEVLQWMDPHFTNLGLSHHSANFNAETFARMRKNGRNNPLEATPERVEELRKLIDSGDLR